jgi:hypothetical protein
MSDAPEVVTTPPAVRPTIAVLKAHQEFVTNRGVPCPIYQPGQQAQPEFLLGNILCKKDQKAFLAKLDNSRRQWRRNNSHPANKAIPDGDDRPLLEEAAYGTLYTGIELFLYEDGSPVPDTIENLRELFLIDYVRERAIAFHNDEKEWDEAEKAALSGNSPKS